MRRIVVLLAVAMLTASMVPVASAQEEKVILRVGLTQNWDTLNPMAGYLVSEWEVWVLQYRGLTNVDDELEPIPDLAESWTASEDGLTYTYTLREGLLWSDGTPITSEDVVWNIETSVEQDWWNHVTTTENLTAVALDERTVEITSSVPDPKLPNMGFLLMPKHVWDPIATDGDAVAEYDALDGVGSGPYVLGRYDEKQSVTMVANPNWWGWGDSEPGVDEIIFRHFSNPDAMVAALERGEIDAAHGVPASAVERLEARADIEVIAGYQGGFEEIAINGGLGEAEPHPALLDIEVRKAMAMAIDRDTIVEDLWYGHAQPIDAYLPSAQSKWTPEIPEGKRFAYDPDMANQLLDEAGYLDTNNDGLREMPDGTNPLVFRHLVNTNTDLGASIGELFTGWMDAIGIGVQLIALDSDQTTARIEVGDYDTFYWGWVPGIDPEGLISVFISDEIGVWNDANWANDRYDELYELQREELDEDARIAMVHEMLTIFHDEVIYIGMVEGPELQAYRTDAFEGWVRQPAEDGPVMFTNSSPSYPLLRVAGSDPGGGDDDRNTWLIVGGVGVVVAAVAALAIRRRQTADEQE